MLKLFNTLDKKLETFKPPACKKIKSGEPVTIFTCGPSVYQRSHIGNFRTFLYEDVLVRYLEYLGHKVVRGMNITDIEDKSIEEAEKRGVSIAALTEKNMEEFIGEMKTLKMKKPDYLPRASDYVRESAEVIQKLLKKGIAYRFKGDIYFDPLKFRGFGKLFGLDMSRWPRKKRRFQKDTYPGMRWNLGDFILWHGFRKGDKYYWDTVIGKGRPSWNVEDASIVVSIFHETLSIYCGAIDNLYRHHDYTLAIAESVRPYPMARFWLHSLHLFVDGKKMAKSRGNVIYLSTLLQKGYTSEDIRFFLIYGRYKEKLNFTIEAMDRAAGKLRDLKKKAALLGKATGGGKGNFRLAERLREVFIVAMDNDLDVKGAVDGVHSLLSDIPLKELSRKESDGAIRELKKIDVVLQVTF